MSTLDPTTLEMIFYAGEAAGEITFAAGPTLTSAREPWMAARPVMRLEGPSTLTLALIGVATLAAYRSIMKRIVGADGAASTRRAPLRSPRRAA
jgi:hypothetical protein